jgi:hypothetical protein
MDLLTVTIPGMPINIDVHPGGDRTALLMLIATICLVFAAAAQAYAAFRQSLAADRQAEAAEKQTATAQRQAEAADRQVQATEKAIEVSRQQIRAAKELEDKRTMPSLHVTIGSYSTESAMPLEVMNQGAGPAMRIACGRHEPGTNRLDEKTLMPLSQLSLPVGGYLTVTVSKANLTPNNPLFIHCFSAQGTEIIHAVFFKPNGGVSVTAFDRAAD